MWFLKDNTLPWLWGKGKELASSPLYRNTFYLWLHAGIFNLTGFIFWALAARLYTAEAVGFGAATFAALSLMALLSNLGLGYGLIRFMPEATDRPLLINSSFTLGGLAALLVSAIFLSGLSLWSPKLLALHQPVYWAAFMLFALAISLSMLVDHAFLAGREARFVLIKNLVVGLGRLGLVLGLAGLLPQSGIIAAVGIAALGSLLIAIPLLRHLYPGYTPRPSLDRPSLSQVVPFSLGNYLSQLLLESPNLLLPLMVVNLLGIESAAYFFIAWLLGSQLLSATAQLAMSVFMEGSHQRGELLNLTARGLFLALALAVVGIALFFVWGDELLRIFGREYSRQGQDLLKVVSLASLPGIATQLYLGVERVRRRTRALLLTSGAVAAVTLAVSYLLLPRLGLVGAGVGLLAGQGTGALIALGRSLPHRREVLKSLKAPGLWPQG